MKTQLIDTPPPNTHRTVEQSMPFVSNEDELTAVVDKIQHLVNIINDSDDIDEIDAALVIAVLSEFHQYAIRQYNTIANACLSLLSKDLVANARSIANNWKSEIVSISDQFKSVIRMTGFTDNDKIQMMFQETIHLTQALLFLRPLQDLDDIRNIDFFYPAEYEDSIRECFDISLGSRFTGIQYKGTNKKFIPKFLVHVQMPFEEGEIRNFISLIHKLEKRESKMLSLMNSISLDLPALQYFDLLNQALTVNNPPEKRIILTGTQERDRINILFSNSLIPNVSYAVASLHEKFASSIPFLDVKMKYVIRMSFPSIPSREVYRTKVRKKQSLK
eukprot:95466-Hanusia_phi.AAC.5